MNKKIKVMVADDHEIVRTGFCALIDLEDDMRCVSMVKNGAFAVEQAAATEPDVIVMDLAMPVLDGIAATRQIVAATPGVRVLILTSLGTPEELQKAMDAGASGILLKSYSGVKRLIEASFAKLGVATRAEPTAMIKDNRLLNDSVISPPPEPSASRS